MPRNSGVQKNKLHENILRERNAQDLVQEGRKKLVRLNLLKERRIHLGIFQSSQNLLLHYPALELASLMSPQFLHFRNRNGFREETKRVSSAREKEEAVLMKEWGKNQEAVQERWFELAAGEPLKIYEATGIFPDPFSGQKIVDSKGRKLYSCILQIDFNKVQKMIPVLVPMERQQEAKQLLRILRKRSNSSWVQFG